MEYKKGYELTLENNKIYTIIDMFYSENKNYLFLIGNVDNDLALVTIENNIITVIESDKEFNKVFNILYNRNEKEILKYIREK